MAIPVNLIKGSYFMSLVGQIEPPRAMLEVDQRGGVDGSEILRTGKRGVPFTLVSTVDCSSYADGQWIFKNEYQQLWIEADAGNLVQSDYDVSTDGYYVKVLGVRMLSLRQARVIVGGLNYTSGAILICEWTLLAIEI